LANALGYGHLLRHIETVVPSGAELQADPEMALRCLGDACKHAAASGVESVILGGAGLAGYAEGLRHDCPVPLIDSAEAGLRVLLDHLAPPAPQPKDGFYAQWRNMTPAIMHIPVRV
jgi:Asp/Glu/hydantoin racemase